MDFVKKYPVLVIGLIVASVLIAAVGARLFFVCKNYQKEKRDLSETGGRLDRLYGRDPFPSESNVRIAKEGLTSLLDEYNELHNLLVADQINPVPMDAYAFNVYLEKKLQSIKNKLLGGRVVFVDKDAFGFDKYTSGNLPNVNDIPRLVQQLLMMEQVCNLLPEAGISELASFTRDQFDVPAATEASASGRRGGRAPAAAGAVRPADENIYSAQHFKMSFRAKEGALFDFLNRLACLPMFTVVTRIEVKNPRLDTSLTALPSRPAVDEKAKGQPSSDQTELSREQRIILGREELDVNMELDVYNFGEAGNYLKNKLKI